MKLLVDDLLLLQDGFKIPTSQHPLGCQVYLQLISICGDLLAIHKVVGFGSPSASQFCAWCMENSNNLHLMQMGPKRPGFTVLESAKEWKSAKTLKGQEELHRRTGIRWSKVNRLTYRIPNMHVALGIMHKWLEGVLAEHFRYCWGFQEDGQEKKRALRKANTKRKRVQ
ncbi:hypothetical protein O181_100203 [Austropuccinia psidii MF-1]|uniref:Uncharacterized protein n=1 Tax=Austropuccinia psidii MF-1 TaxID=1389203 RepID=A0A9Q3JE79_9BASI|nr:hypothetical protein [Austropuccinia psidii MF-1]